MIYRLNPPLSVPLSAEPSEDRVIEYADYREVADERRPARATGSWARVWDRVEAASEE